MGFGSGVKATANGDQFALGGQQMSARPRYVGSAEVFGADSQVSRRNVQPVSQLIAVCRRLLEPVGCHPARLSCGFGQPV